MYQTNDATSEPAHVIEDALAYTSRAPFSNADATSALAGFVCVPTSHLARTNDVATASACLDGPHRYEDDQHIF